MNRLFRSNSTVSSSRSSSSNIPNIVNEEEYECEITQPSWSGWNIPKVPNKEIYKVKKSSWLLPKAFDEEFQVKTIEQVHPLREIGESYQLLKKETLKDFKSKGFNFIHLGLVQVAIKPLITTGKDSAVLLTLCDGRFRHFQPSLLGMMQAGLHNGPVYFNCFPDFTLSLRDEKTVKALTLRVNLTGEITDLETHVDSIVLIYRIYYKCIRTNLNVNAINRSLKDVTLLMEPSTADANIQIPKKLQWKDITLPKKWLIQNPDYKPESIETESDLEKIKQFSDGSVEISFGDTRSQSSRISSFHETHYNKPIIIDEGRKSESYSKRDKEIDKELQYRFSKMKMKGVED